MEIIHNKDNRRFETQEDGYTAYASYLISNGQLDIRHTIVPKAIGGRGIASALVKAAYDYALSNNLQPVATCSYALIWLQRHPEYNGKPSSDCTDTASCAL